MTDKKLSEPTIALGFTQNYLQILAQDYDKNNHSDVIHSLEYELAQDAIKVLYDSWARKDLERKKR